MSLSPGTRIGPYEVGAQLGAGGMGEVYRAHDAKLNRDVAIKVLAEIGRSCAHHGNTVALVNAHVRGVPHSLELG